ncbi:division/cell wall cluster transcriptional repressor MraZ [Poriferisphaera sp. WC338]|uniref:division/cell wall cluster transcriptional repressor MraZ n=1 Tax=Poriferisphaera sp. WC338 TaxID=3425129 RepID=UPI003D8132A7
MVFTGTYEHTIDAKNRLAIPATIRNQILRSVGAGEGNSVALYITPGEAGPGGPSLSIYTEAYFDRRAAELDQSEQDADEILDYEEMFYSMASRVEIDKQGRIRLPESVLAESGLGTDVVLLGVKDHLQIRDRKTWKDYIAQRLKENPGLLRNPRRMMRR